MRTAWLASVLLALLVFPGEGAAQEREPFLSPPGGPYRGTVSDATTSRPIPDAVVVLLWYRADDQAPGRRLFEAGEETLTNEAGAFVLDVSAAEARLPRRTYGPRLVIFKSGYTVFPAGGDPTVGASARPFRGEGIAVRLTPVTGYEARTESLNQFTDRLPATLFSSRLLLAVDIFRSEVKELMRLGPPGPAERERERQRRIQAGAECPPVEPKKDEERYLKGSHGPYRGRVIDAATKAPLAGAVVVAVWRRELVHPLIRRAVEHYAARETLTDANGEFLLRAGDVECNAPPRLLRPTFVVFLPGYGFSPGRFGEAGGIVELPRLRTVPERRHAIGTLHPPSLSEAPFTELPAFMKLLNQESVAAGCRPREPGTWVPC